MAVTCRKKPIRSWENTITERQMESAVECSLQVTDKYKGWLNCSYDEQLEGLQLPWLPWIGTGFREQKVRTVILGESVYDYSKGDAAKRKSIQQQDGLRTRHLKHAIYAKFKSRYVRNFERTYYGKKKPSSKERQDLWGRVAYHNLVLRMLHSEKARPSDADYRSGWERFIDLAGCLDVQQVVVYGLERRKIDALRSRTGKMVAGNHEVNSFGKARLANSAQYSGVLVDGPAASRTR